MNGNSFFFADDNQNSCRIFTKIFMMYAVDHERKIYYEWPWFYPFPTNGFFNDVI